jgi:hypothetical protein
MTIVRTGTAKMLKEYFGIEPDVTELMFDNEFLSEQKCRDALIRNEFKEKSCPKEKVRIMGRLADKYSISVKMIETILYKSNGHSVNS